MVRPQTMACSFYPRVVPAHLAIYWAAAPVSLRIILIGGLSVVPVIAGYTVLVFFVFRGKATDLRYC